MGRPVLEHVAALDDAEARILTEAAGRTRNPLRRLWLRARARWLSMRAAVRRRQAGEGASGGAATRDHGGVQHSHDAAGAGEHVEVPQHRDAPPQVPGAGESNHVHGRQRAAAGESRK